MKSLVVPSDLMRIAVKLFLNVPLKAKHQKCPACQKSFEDFNTHILTCSSEQGLIRGMMPTNFAWLVSVPMLGSLLM